MVLPTTQAAEAMRSIISRGWSMVWLHVWRGFAVTGGWIVFMFFAAVYAMKNIS
jgi:ABC-type multidrug transport system permease subunit